MAAPITHIVLALSILPLLSPTLDKAAFIVGTSFPDIRHKAQLSRKSTHIEPVSWLEVLTCTSSFQAGMLFHNIVDIRRMDYFERYFYDRYSPWQYSSLYNDLYPLVLKMAEDIILYDRTNDWHEIISYFNAVYDEELALCPNEKLVKEWHTLLQNYCRQKPSFKTITTFLAESGGNLTIWLNSKDFDTNKTLNTLVENPYFRERLHEFYDTIKQLLNNELLVTKPMLQHKVLVSGIPSLGLSVLAARL